MGDRHIHRHKNEKKKKKEDSLLIILKKFSSTVACIKNEQSFCSYDWEFLNTNEGKIRV